MIACLLPLGFERGGRRERATGSARHGRWYFALVLISVILFCLECRADLDHCAICGHVLDKKVYILTDKVTGEKTHVCPDCADLPNNCFVCGLPVKEGYTEL